MIDDELLDRKLKEKAKIQKLLTKCLICFVPDSDLVQYGRKASIDGKFSAKRRPSTTNYMRKLESFHFRLRHRIYLNAEINDGEKFNEFIIKVCELILKNSEMVVRCRL